MVNKSKVTKLNELFFSERFNKQLTRGQIDWKNLKIISIKDPYVSVQSAGSKIMNWVRIPLRDLLIPPCCTDTGKEAVNEYGKSKQ